MTRPVALVTGGTRGIGLGIAHALGTGGHDLCVCGIRDAAATEDALAKLRTTGAAVHYAQADIGSSDARATLIESVKSAFGRLDVLVNNAGVAPKERRDILDADEEAYDWLMNINLKGPWFLTRDVARWMIAQRDADPGRRCSVVNIGSVSADVASANRGEYCLSKAALGMATQLWAARLGEYGIPVWEIRPGIIATDMTSKVAERYDAFIADGGLVEPRWGTPEDIGRAVAMLVRGDLPYAPGQVLTLDGGLTMRRL
ncbi:MAG: 3-ketoacyl-ACP reductase [Planctomycetes bacterium]|nr:3-ketoacyl-ACP reductase [Planctomycetota bacterium]